MLLKENNPWLGLESYSVEDSNRFYGRDNDIEVVSNTIYDNFITTIYGISGAGKTSLINAGITPILKKNGYLPIRIRLKHRSAESYDVQIINAICTAVEAIDGEVEYDGNIELEAIHENEKLWFFLHTRKFWTHDNYPIKPVLFIDQFEEIFTQNSEGEKVANFFESINSVQQHTPPTFTRQLLEEEERTYFDLGMNISRMVFIIREDFLARLEDYSYGIAALRRNRIGIKRMNGTQALDVILKPDPDIVTPEGAIRILSKVSGKEVSFSEKVLTHLSIDTSILSLFCSELYQRAVESGSDAITVELIEEFGNDIISQFYSNSMNNVNPALAEYLEIHLLTSSGFRNSVAYEDIIVPKVSNEDVAKGLNMLAEKRILRIEDVDGVVRVEFTHDVLCKVAKAHRNSLKEESEKKSTLIKTVIRTIEQIAIVTIAVAVILLFRSPEHLVQGFFRAVWILACGLFISLFFGKKSTRSKYLNFGLSVLLSLLLIHLPKLSMVLRWDEGGMTLRVTLLVLSIVLSVFAFLSKKNSSRLPTHLLMYLDLLMMLLFNKGIFGLTLIASPILATIPLKYSDDKNAGWICALAAVCTGIMAILTGNEEFILLAPYPLIGLLFRHRDGSKSFKSSLQKCLRFEAWRNDRTWMLTVLIIAIFGLFLWCDVMGDKKVDTAILYYTPIVTFVLYSFIKTSYDLLFNYKKDNFEDSLRSTFRQGAIVGGISLIVVLFQYITYGFIYMMTIWLAITGIIIWKRRDAIVSKNYLKGLALPLILILICTCAVPLKIIGYDASRHVRYARVIGKQIYSDNFILIRDNNGNYGIRDIYNIIVPVEYSDVYPYVRMTDISGMAIQKNKKYEVIQRDYPGYEFISYELDGFGYYERQNSFPDIVFSLQGKVGDHVTWHCNEHMSELNVCTAAILESAWDNIINSSELHEDYIHKYLSSIDELGENASKKAEQIIIKQLDNIAKLDYRIESLNDLRENRNRLQANGSSHTIQMCHKTLSYVGDMEFVNYILDTLYLPTTNESHDLWAYYSNKAQYYIYTNQFRRAEKCASTAMMYDSTLTYGYKNMIVAKVLLGKYDEAYDLLQRHGDGMHYMGSLTDIYPGNAELDIIHNKSDDISTLLRFNNLYNGVYNELNSIEMWNTDIDTTLTSYKEFKEFVKSKCIRPYDSAEDKGNYYLCRKYEYYHSPLEEWYAVGYIAPQYKLEYQFYMKDNVEISPAFDTYGHGNDVDIMLLIDYDDTKRKYIDMSREVPEMVPGEYDHAWNFSEGVAAVVNNGKLGFIDMTGKYVIDSIFTYSVERKYGVDRYNRQKSNIVDYTFENGKCRMKDENGKYGVIDKSGAWVIKPEYSYIESKQDASWWLLVKNEQGQNLFGAADYDGNMILDVEYDDFLNYYYGPGYMGYFGKEGDYTGFHMSRFRPYDTRIESGYDLVYEYDEDMGDWYWKVTTPWGNTEYYSYLLRY